MRARRSVGESFRSTNFWASNRSTAAVIEPLPPGLAALAEVAVAVPSLRERSEDVLPLAEHFLAALGQAARLGEALSEARNAANPASGAAPGATGGVTGTSITGVAAAQALTPERAAEKLRALSAAGVDRAGEVGGVVVAHPACLPRPRRRHNRRPAITGRPGTAPRRSG